MAEEGPLTVTVRLFARVREVVGREVITVPVGGGGTVGDLRRRLIQDYPELAELLRHSALAVHDELADESQPLTAAAEVVLLPPVSGG